TPLGMKRPLAEIVSCWQECVPLSRKWRTELSMKISVDLSGNKRLLQVVGVGPKGSSCGAEHFFEVRLTDLDGNVPEGVPDPLAGPLRYDEAMAAAERLAAENGLRLANEL